MFTCDQVRLPVVKVQPTCGLAEKITLESPPPVEVALKSSGSSVQGLVQFKEVTVAAKLLYTAKQIIELPLVGVNAACDSAQLPLA